MTRTTVTATLLALSAVLGSGCAGTAGRASATGSAKPVADRELGLSSASVFDTPVPPAMSPETSDPGERPVVAPAYPGAPPVIPHGVADFLPLTADSNPCIDCHAVEEKVAGEPTPIPASHFVDLREAPDRKSDEVVGARYVCISCHATRTDAAPLVPNRFGSP